MEFNQFALSSTKIKSNWFDGKKKSIFNKIGKEEGLNLYLQLFRFRQHQIIGDDKENYNHHVFRITIGEMVKFTKMNLKKKLTHNQILELMRKMENAGIIKLHTPYRWDQLIDDNGKVKSDKLIVLEAADVPNTHIKKNHKGLVEDKPNTEEDYYIPINFKTIDYMYNDLLLSSKEVSVYLLLLKLSGSGERKANININTIKEWLGYGNDTITNILINLNKNCMVATYTKRSKKGINYEHVPVRSYKYIESFKKVNHDAFRVFLNRYKNKTNNPFIEVEEGNDNPFHDVDDNAIGDEWDISPNGY
ncbi:hypothetical protein KGF86_06940 [Ornithinibacillus massiliensis]|uniref:Uncharacterized protein n=1 Tax=Ornithinibacillus massiliensis TaxID=1944633 RepID=A0ABS5MC93_9BACI|nr:hypothetical protein [Ornithinibacillus massiliensis]MBS3679943.1 hypothetical protein [Ornithinibacillus massiliensis]